MRRMQRASFTVAHRTTTLQKKSGCLQHQQQLREAAVAAAMGAVVAGERVVAVGMVAAAEGAAEQLQRPWQMLLLLHPSVHRPRYHWQRSAS